MDEFGFGQELFLGIIVCWIKKYLRTAKAYKKIGWTGTIPGDSDDSEKHQFLSSGRKPAVMLHRAAKKNNINLVKCICKNTIFCRISNNRFTVKYYLILLNVYPRI